MNKKISFIILALFLLITSAFSQESHLKYSKEDKAKLLTSMGVVYTGMPKKDLPEAGYTENLLVNERHKDNKEWLTFQDWTTDESGDTITFLVVDGKVESWGQDQGSIEKELSAKIKEEKRAAQESRRQAVEEFFKGLKIALPGTAVIVVGLLAGIYAIWLIFFPLLIYIRLGKILKILQEMLKK